MLADYEGLLRLLVAHVKLWLRDAQHNEEELAEVAAWLGMTPARLRRYTDGPQATTKINDLYRQCPGCGSALPEYNESKSGAGRQRLYCNDRCRRRATKLRKETGNDTQ